MKEINYLKHAFTEKFNYILLFLIIFSLFFIKKLFLPLVFIEIFYLFMITQSDLYRNYIKKKFYLNTENKKTKIYELDSIFREKAEKLYDKLNQVNLHIKNKNLQDLLSKEVQELNYLFENYVNFATSITNYNKYLNENNISQIEQEIHNLKYRIENYLEGTKCNDLDEINVRLQKRTLLLENLKILEKRRNKIKEIKYTLDKLKAQLELIEDTFQLISDNLITFGNVDNLNINVNNVISSIENTENIVKSTEKEMNELKRLMNTKKLLK